MIVGGLLVSGLAFGAGTASADEIVPTPSLCAQNTVALTRLALSRQVDPQQLLLACDRLEARLNAIAEQRRAAAALKAAQEKAAADAKKAQEAADKAAEDAAGSSPVTIPDPPVTEVPASTEPSDPAGPSVGTPVPGASAGGSSPTAGPPAQPGPRATAMAGPGGAFAVAPGAVAAAPAAGLTPTGGGGGGLMAGLLTTPLGAPVGIGSYDPGLLLSAPPGALALAANDPASAVTTASQVQAMALDGLPGGPGVPATIGVLILAGLGGIALRHRLLSRAKRAATSA